MLSDRPHARLARITVSLGLVAGLGACHTFSDDPNRTTWPAEPSLFPLTFVSGRVFVRGTQTPIVGAVVTSAHTSSVTDQAGFYALDGIRSVQTLVVSAKAGYDTARVSLPLSGGNLTYNITLVPVQP